MEKKVEKWESGKDKKRDKSGKKWIGKWEKSGKEKQVLDKKVRKSGEKWKSEKSGEKSGGNCSEKNGEESGRKK